MQRDWFMYHLRSNYKNRLEFPFMHSDTRDKDTLDLKGKWHVGGIQKTQKTFPPSHLFWSQLLLACALLLKVPLPLPLDISRIITLIITATKTTVWSQGCLPLSCDGEKLFKVGGENYLHVGSVSYKLHISVIYAFNGILEIVLEFRRDGKKVQYSVLYTWVHKEVDMWTDLLHRYL